MILIETDILLALVSVKDRHHKEALKVVDRFKGRTVLSPYSLLELDLIIMSGKILIRDIFSFYQSLSTLLDYRRIKIIPPKPSYHAEANKLRKRYVELTYFDSLHAAVSLSEKLEHVSYDSIYEGIEELNYVHPSKYV